MQARAHTHTHVVVYYTPKHTNNIDFSSSIQFSVSVWLRKIRSIVLVVWYIWKTTILTTRIGILFDSDWVMKMAGSAECLQFSNRRNDIDPIVLMIISRLLYKWKFASLYWCIALKRNYSGTFKYRRRGEINKVQTVWTMLHQTNHNHICLLHLFYCAQRKCALFSVTFYSHSLFIANYWYGDRSAHQAYIADMQLYVSFILYCYDQKWKYL